MKTLLIVCVALLGVSCTGRTISTASGLTYRILEKGKGPKAQAGDAVFIHETTTYRDGTVLYTNYESSSAVRVLIGGNQATAAVDEGLRGMRVGEVRELTAPPFLVKRTSYPPNVSPDSTLVIKMRLAKIERSGGR